MMRGTDAASGSRFSYVDLEEPIPLRHPLRKVRQIVNDALAKEGGPGDPPGVTPDDDKPEQT